MSEFNLCGYIRNEDGDVERIFFRTHDNDRVELAFNNEPYGIVSMYGDIPWGIKEIEVGTNDPDMQADLAIMEMLVNNMESEHGVFVLEDGNFVYIDSISPFEGRWCPRKKGTANEFPIDWYIDVTEMDDANDIAEVMSLVEAE